MGDLSKNFSRSEFECECGCGFNAADHVLIDSILEWVRAHFARKYQAKVKVIITGGNRCRAYNQKLREEAIAAGKPHEAPAEHSLHIFAMAADFKVYWLDESTQEWNQVDPDEVADALEKEYPDRFGIGRYNGRTHADSRTGKARWDDRKPRAA